MNSEIESGLAFSPASERNKQPILEVLQRFLPVSGCVLEIGSGTGQHAVHFAARLPQLQWQPSDRADHLPGLRQRFAAQGSGNLLPPLELDVSGDWPEHKYQAAYSANTVHIMSWPEVECLFRRLPGVLQPGARFFLYGPFKKSGRHTAPSNAAFDDSLRQQAPHMGLRDIDALENLAGDQQMTLQEDVAMPANNSLLVFVYGDQAL